VHFSSQEVTDARREFRPSSVVNKLTRRELGKYSFARELIRIATGADENSFEKEVTQLAYGGHAPLDVGRRIMVPWQVVQRDLATSTGPKGGYLVGVDSETEIGLVAALAPLSVVMAAGARELSGLRSNVLISRVVSGVSASWVGEGVGDLADDPVLGALSLQARRIIAITELSRQLIVQSPRLVNQFAVRDLAAAVAAAFDQAAVAGTGGTEPLGILNSGVQSVSGTSLAWSGVVNMKKRVSGTNAQDGNIAYVGATAVRELLEARTRETGGGTYIWEDERIASRPAFASASVPAGTLIAGDWSQLIVGTWADGLEITLGLTDGSFNAGRIAVRASLMADVVVANPQAFAVATSIT
jgi:HK97 family phage major capsid protein